MRGSRLRHHEVGMPRIGEILTQAGACTAEAVALALRNQGVRGGRLGTNLLDLGIVTEEQLAQALERCHGRFCLRGKITVDPKVAAALHRDLAARHEVIPYAVNERRLTVLSCDPGDLQSLDELAFAVGKDVRALLAPQARIWSLLRSLYGVERGLRGVAVGSVALGQLRAVPRPSVGPGWRSRGQGPRRTDDGEPQERCGEAIASPSPEPSPVVGPRHLGDALRAMESGRPDEVLRALLGFAGVRYRRAVLLVVRPGNPGVAVGWEGTGEGLEPARVRRLVMVLQPGNVVHQAVTCQGPVLGPLAPTEANQRLLADLDGDAPGSALAVPVMVRGQALAVLYADDGPGRCIGPDVGEVLMLVGMAGRVLDHKLVGVGAHAR